MAITSNSVIHIRRSYQNTAPTTLEDAELGYSFVSNTLFIGNSNNIVTPIAGKNYIANVITQTVKDFGIVRANNITITAANASDVLVINPGHGTTITTNPTTHLITIAVDETQISSFVKKTGDVMTGDLTLNSANLDASYVIVENTLYSGLATRSATPLPNLIAQFTGNTHTYVQVNAQNIDQHGTADYVITADVGHDDEFYVDMGIINSAYNNLSPNNSLGTAAYPLDGYLYVQGSSIDQLGGNLIIGTTHTDTRTRFISGGINSQNVILDISETGEHNYKDLVVDGTISGPSISTMQTYTQAAFNKANAAYVLGTYDSDRVNAAFDTANTSFIQASAAYTQANTPPAIANSAALYANGAFVEANSAYQSQNTTGVYANAAYAQANSASLYANGAFIEANAAYSFANTVYSNYAYPAYVNTLSNGLYANGAFIEANSAYASQNTTGIYANSAFTAANSAGSYANSGFAVANSASSYANGAFREANSAYAQANSASLYANGAFIEANSAYASQNVTGTYANAAYAQANSASLYANGAFIEANSAYASQNVTGIYANAAYAQANTATTNAATADSKAVTAGSYANSAYTQANTATNNAAGASLYANGAFLEANAAYNSQNTTGVYANSAYEQANTANTNATTGINNAAIADSKAVTAGSYANSAYEQANSASLYANGAFVEANSAYVRANNSLNANVGGAVTGTIFISTGSSESLNTSGPVYVGSDLTVKGNIYLSGTATQYNANVLSVDDPMIYLSKNNTSDAVDIGFYGHFIGPGNSGYSHYQHTGFVRDYDDKKWKLFSNVPEPAVSNSYINFTNAIYDTLKVGTIEADTSNIGGYDLLVYTNNAFAVANSGSLYANGAFSEANAAYNKANTAIVLNNQTIHLGDTSNISSIWGTSYNNPDMVVPNWPDIAWSYGMYGVDPDYFMQIKFWGGDDTHHGFRLYDYHTNTSPFIVDGTGTVTIPGSISNPGLTSLTTYSQASFLQANSAYASQNVTGTYANNAYNQANSAASYANSAFINSNSSYAQANSAALYANGAFLEANSAYASQNVTGIYANSAYEQANTATLNGSQAFIKANAAYDSQNTTGIYANSAYSSQNTTGIYANSSFAVANSASLYANGAFLQANSAYASQNVTGTYANGAYAQANSAALYANGAFIQANAAFIVANNALPTTGGQLTGLITSSNNIVANSITANTSVSVNAIATLVSNTFTTSSTSSVSIDSFSTSTYRSAKYFVQLTSGSNHHIAELNLLHDGSTVYLAQYGEINTGSSLGAFDAAITAGVVNLNLTPTNSITYVNLARTSIIAANTSGGGGGGGNLGSITVGNTSKFNGMFTSYYYGAGTSMPGGVSNFGTLTSSAVQWLYYSPGFTHIKLVDGTYTGFTVTNGGVNGDTIGCARDFTVGSTTVTFIAQDNGGVVVYVPLNTGDSFNFQGTQGQTLSFGVATGSAQVPVITGTITIGNSGTDYGYNGFGSMTTSPSGIFSNFHFDSGTNTTTIHFNAGTFGSATSSSGNLNGSTTLRIVVGTYGINVISYTGSYTLSSSQDLFQIQANNGSTKDVKVFLV